MLRIAVFWSCFGKLSIESFGERKSRRITLIGEQMRGSKINVRLIKGYRDDGILLLRRPIGQSVGERLLDEQRRVRVFRIFQSKASAYAGPYGFDRLCVGWGQS